MRTLRFRVPDMDCAEEVRILREALGPLVGVPNLGFDVLRRTMTVRVPDEDDVTTGDVERAVRQAGLRAVPAEAGGRGEDAGRRRVRSVLLLAATVLLVVAVGLDAAARGFAAALGAAEGARPPPAIALALYLVATLVAIAFVLPKAWHAARRLRPDMNLLMTIAVAGAVALGAYFEAAAVGVLFGLALLLESWSVGRARHAIERVLDLAPPVARVLDETGAARETPVADVPVGARLQVRPGERIPLDGVVVEGHGHVDQAPITGESVPEAKEPGDEVYAATINGDGLLVVETTHAAEDTTLARILHLVEEAQGRRARTERWVERFARWYTPFMLVVAALIAVAPPLLLGGAWSRWIYEALVVLVIACPCALVISTPVSIVAGIACAARVGVLVKGGAFLEAPAGVRAVAVDKTGTLTRGRPEVVEIVAIDDHTDDWVLATAAGLEAASTHPIALAITGHAEAAGVAPAAVEAARTLPGRGAEGRVEGRLFWVGSHRLLHERGAETPDVHARMEAFEAAGHLVMALGTEDHVCGLIALADALRPDAAASVAAMREAGVEHVVMLTGDHETTARQIAAAAGVDAHRAGLLPEDKVAAVEDLVAHYGRVAMVGDGVNDAPALARATVGIAIGAAGNDAAIEAADVALLADDLGRVPWLVRHARRTLRVIRQNVVLALASKALVLALALVGVATLWLAIAADMGASLLVIANALRLLRPQA